MWVFTKIGLFSAVQHRDDPHLIMIRAILKADTIAFNKFLKTRYPGWKGRSWTEIKDADYRFRINVTVVDWGFILKELGSLVDYPKFKPAAHDGLKGREEAYLKVFFAMMDLQALHDVHGLVEEAEIRKVQKGEPRKAKKKPAKEPGLREGLRAAGWTPDKS